METWLYKDRYKYVRKLKYKKLILKKMNSIWEKIK